MTPSFPLSTGQAAQLLGTTEPKLAEEVRRGRITPPPPILAGRRLWRADHVLQAATNLGLFNDDLQKMLSEEASRAS